VFWTSLSCAWTFSTLLGFVALPRNHGDIDILKIVIVALCVKHGITELDPWKLTVLFPPRSGLLGLFTLTMFGTHVRLILLNLTTVEQMKVEDIKEEESAKLAGKYPTCAFAKKRREKARWDEEWGRPAIEGNIWWLGSGRKNWESVMGQSIWCWFREFRGPVILPPRSYLPILFKVPVGKAENDGLDYPVNPRFDDQGRWRRRAEWPPHLR